MQGTISVLFGTHSIVHSLLVIISWRKLYGKMPAFWELVCILLHDIGHIGKQYLDNLEAKQEHWILGAKISDYLFGEKGFLLVAGHCVYSSYPESKLYKPDKYALHIAPTWWLLLNTVFEPKLKTGYSARESVRVLQQRVKESVESGEYHSSHDFYLQAKEDNED